MSSPGVTFNLTCGKGVTELQNLSNLLLSFFAESHQTQQKNLTSSLMPDYMSPRISLCVPYLSTSLEDLVLTGNRLIKKADRYSPLVMLHPLVDLVKYL